MKKLFIILTTLCVLAFGLNLTVQIYLDKKLNLTGDALIEINKGASLTKVAAQLSRLQIIVYPRLFVKVGQYYGYSDSIKYGEYLLKPTDSYRNVLEKLVSGENYKYDVTFVEGDHIYKYASLLEERGLCKKEEFLNLVKNKVFIRELLGENINSLEGYLFPETYHFSKIDGVKTIVKTMVQKFLNEIKSLSIEKTSLSRHQLVTLASIVEKETGASFERPMIASVFMNRLKKRMRLQTDPTIIYGIMNETGEEIKNIRKKHLKQPTAYNTYVINGLPPGPIGNPGIEALKASVNPEKTSFLYFVSQNDGTHVFTKNYKDHLKAVKKFQMNPKMRQGKSWRDLKKRAKK